MQARGWIAVVALVIGCGPRVDADAGALDGSGCTRVCDDGVFCNGVERCAPGDATADEDGCAPSVVAACGSTERCDEASAACRDGSCATNADADGDGVDSIACGGEDCDDADAVRFGGNVEVCDAGDVDEDCAPSTQATRGGVGDLDGDGHAIPTCCNVDEEGARRCGGDCDDARADRRAAGAELCDGIDNDCDGEIDEHVQFDFGLDADHDRSGAPGGAPERGCYAPPGRAVVSPTPSLVDCDDTDPTVSPMHLELCEGVDNDCDGTTDEDCACDEGTSRRCEVCVTAVRRCTGGVLGACEAAATEVCNSADDDCDARVDEGFPTITCFDDDDQDGFAAGGARSVLVCAASGECPNAFGRFTTDRPPVGPENVDCDDDEATRRPGAEELCNGANDDCDSAIDEGC